MIRRKHNHRLFLSHSHIPQYITCTIYMYIYTNICIYREKWILSGLFITIHTIYGICGYMSFIAALLFYDMCFLYVIPQNIRLQHHLICIEEWVCLKFSRANVYEYEYSNIRNICNGMCVLMFRLWHVHSTHGTIYIHIFNGTRDNPSAYIQYMLLLLFYIKRINCCATRTALDYDEIFKQNEHRKASLNWVSDKFSLSSWM